MTPGTKRTAAVLAALAISAPLSLALGVSSIGAQNAPAGDKPASAEAPAKKADAPKGAEKAAEAPATYKLVIEGIT
jgi:hypothetical protein